MTTERLLADARQLLATLVAMDTTSWRSNLELIDYLAETFARYDIPARRIFSADRKKANLVASIGPDVPGGTVLSGHTDVVPCDGQPWMTNPFELVERDGRLFGRGTSDMKGFIACAMAALPLFARPGLARPIHFAWSYDEEVGCTGAPAMVAELARTVPPPATVIVGEPSEMRVVAGHKGIRLCRVSVRGREAHSSLTHLGVSANMIAARLLAKLAEIGAELEARPPAQAGFQPPHSTLTVGLLQGGTAVNILARECTFTFDLRCVPGEAPDAVLAPFFASVDALNRDIRARFPETGIEVEMIADVPQLTPEPNGDAAALAHRLSSSNGPVAMVPFASEAGLFQNQGFSTVVCGPGSIEQAHQPNEFIAEDQLRACVAFMARLDEAMRARD